MALQLDDPQRNRGDLVSQWFVLQLRNLIAAIHQLPEMRLGQQTLGARESSNFELRTFTF